MFNKNFHKIVFVKCTYYSYSYVIYVICRVLQDYTIPSAVYICYVYVGKDQFRNYAMELVCFVNLTFIFVINILFFFLGMCLNSLVIVSFWRSVQLRKKLCYFTIIILSCCDLLVVLTNHPSTALVTILWLTKNINVYPSLLLILQGVLDVFFGFSLLALLAMNIDRYLATHYPSNIPDERETFNSFYVRSYFWNNSGSDVCKRLGHLLSSWSSYILYYCNFSLVIYKLQIVYSRQEKSWKQQNITWDEEIFFFEEYIKLFVGSRLSSCAVHSNFHLYWTKINFERYRIYFG